MYQASTDGSVPNDARLIMSAKPQHDSIADNGFSLYADTVAAFDKPYSNMVGNTMTHSNVMFYQTNDISKRPQGYWEDVRLS